MHDQETQFLLPDSIDPVVAWYLDKTLAQQKFKETILYPAYKNMLEYTKDDRIWNYKAAGVGWWSWYVGSGAEKVG